ncbi:MAG: hypothetical protein RL716_1181, partial [Actinomycetota bacterium]
NSNSGNIESFIVAANGNERFTRRVLLVEDEQLTRSLIQEKLSQSGFDVRGCSSALEAKKLVASFDPDALVVDIELGPGPTGLELIQVLQVSKPHLAFVVLSNYSATKEQISHLRKAAFLPKQDVSDPNMLVQALNSVLTDRDTSASFPLKQSDVLSKLTKGQIEILRLLARGLSNVEIAELRGTSLHASEQLIKRTYVALGIENEGRSSRRIKAARIYTSIAGSPRN